MAQVIWTDGALADLEDIGEYIAKDSIKYAELTVKELFEYPDILEKFPKIGKRIDEFNDPTLRQLIKGSYRIVYKIISEDKVEIMVVHNCARLISNDKITKRRTNH